MQILCVDIGTSSFKAAVIDEKGKMLAFNKTQIVNDGNYNVSAQWIKALKESVKKFAEENSGNLEKSAAEKIYVKGICISGNGPTIVLENGKTLLWNDDTSDVKTEYNGKSIFMPRILAFKNKFEEEWNNCNKIFSGPEYLIWYLTGKALTILPEIRFEPAYWNKAELENWGFSEADCNKLPAFEQSGVCAGTLTSAIVNELNGQKIGLTEEAKVFTGAPDFVSALVGTGTIQPGRLCDRAGSSEGLNFCTDKPFFAEGIRTLPSVISGLWNQSVLIPDSGKKLSAIKEKLEKCLNKELSFDQFIELSWYIESDREETNPELKKLREEGKDCLEEIIDKVRNGINLLRKNFSESSYLFPTQIRVTGGQASSVLWNSLKANFTGRNYETMECQDAELLGDAVFAFTAMGVFKDLQSAAKALCHIKDVFASKYCVMV